MRALGPLVAAETQRFLYIVTRGTELDLRKRLRVRYYLSGRRGDELNNGAMAQLVARFHGMEEVGGSNPPSSTGNSDTQVVSVGFLGLRVKMCVWLGVSRGLDLAFLNAD